MSVFHEKLIESNILFASFTLYGSPVRTVLTICSQLKKYTVIKSQCLHKNELTIHCQPEWITVSTSMRHHHVASTLIRRHFYVMCPLGLICTKLLN